MDSAANIDLDITNANYNHRHCCVLIVQRQNMEISLPIYNFTYRTMDSVCMLFNCHFIELSNIVLKGLRLIAEQHGNTVICKYKSQPIIQSV